MSMSSKYTYGVILNNLETGPEPERRPDLAAVSGEFERWPSADALGRGDRAEPPTSELGASVPSQYGYGLGAGLDDLAV
jgi:hypothetical protein